MNRLRNPTQQRPVSSLNRWQNWGYRLKSINIEGSPKFGISSEQLSLEKCWKKKSKNGPPPSPSPSPKYEHKFSLWMKFAARDGDLEPITRILSRGCCNRFPWEGPYTGGCIEQRCSRIILMSFKTYPCNKKAVAILSVTQLLSLIRSNSRGCETSQEWYDNLQVTK